MLGSFLALGSACILTALCRGYSEPGGHGLLLRIWVLHSTCSSNGWLISPLPVAPQVFESSASGETPSGNLLRRRQLTGWPPKKVIWPMSPLVGLPKKPFFENWFSKIWLPQSSYRQP